MQQIVRVSLYKELIMKSVRLFSLFGSIAFVHGLLGMEVEEDNKLIILGAGRISTHMTQEDATYKGDEGNNYNCLTLRGLKTLCDFPEELQVKIIQHLMKDRPVIPAMMPIVLQNIKLPTEKRHNGFIRLAECSPDGSKVIIRSKKDNTATIWDVQTEECLHTLTGHNGWILSVARSPDGSKVITGLGHGTATIWNAATGDCLHTLTGHNASVSSVAWSPNGSKVLTGSWDGTAKIWDVQTGECLHTLTHNGWICPVAWNPDGSKVLTGSKAAKIWDISKLIDVENSFNNQTLEQALLLDIIYKKAIAQEKIIILSHGETEAFHTLLPEVQHALRSHVILRSHATDSACIII